MPETTTPVGECDACGADPAPLTPVADLQLCPPCTERAAVSEGAR